MSASMLHRIPFRRLCVNLPAFGLVLLASAAAAVPDNGAPAAASQRVTLPVMAAAPFDVPRSLMVPPGFSIRVLARVPGARFMALAPNGDLLVSSPDAGRITLLRPNGTGSATAFPFADGLNMPHDMAFHTSGNTSYLYVAESNRIARAVYTAGSTALAELQVVIDHLPDAATPGLHGRYNHPLKNFTLHGNHLYLSIGSSCNACHSDTEANPVRGAIYEYDENGQHGRLLARGIRNAEGVRVRPGTDELWAVVNNRDNIGYPLHRDFDGDGDDDFGQVLRAYVDDHPPDLLIKVRDGANYGWPFCNSNPDQGLDRMPYQRDAELNPAGTRLNCNSIEPVTKGLPAHSAPLGLSFLQESGLPPAYRNALVTALHGCWNCSVLNGHQVVLYPFQADGSVGQPVVLVSGWLTDAAARQRWGRPVAAIPDGRQGLYISDDMSGTIYQLIAAGGT